MRRRSLFVLTAALALQTFPSLAGTPGGVVTPELHQLALTTQDSVAELHGARLVGVTWTAGRPTVRLRWHTSQGWGPWTVAEQDTGDSPEGTPGTEPQWRPQGADRVQVKAVATGLTLVTVTDGVVHKVYGAVANAATGTNVLGEVHSRAAWGADESMRRSSPSYASKVVAVTVHHTDNANGYAPDEVPAIIRADYAYHVQGRGWADLGYNLLVDEYGQVWEGRYGGLGRATIGAHAEGFNTGTLGVAMIGDMTKTHASAEAENAFARVIAYAATTWHFDPTTAVQMRSKGSPRYASGRVVTLPRVFGHGRTGITDCPGSLMERLPALAKLSEAVLAAPPRILSTVIDGAPMHAPQPLTLTGKLSRSASWVVRFTDARGATITLTHGTGVQPDLTWTGMQDGLPMIPGSTVSWKVSVTDGFHPTVSKSGTFQVGLPLL